MNLLRQFKKLADFASPKSQGLAMWLSQQVKSCSKGEKRGILLAGRAFVSVPQLQLFPAVLIGKRSLQNAG
jgi:hypothetical protein